jgi:hypothetical protein
MTGASVPQSSDWSVVQTDAGPVTLAAVEALRARAAQLQDWASKAEATLATMRDQATERLAAAGAVLVPRSNEWTVPPTLQTSVDRAKALVAQIAVDDEKSDELKTRESEGGVLGRIGAWRTARTVKQQRTTESAELRGLLVAIAKGAPESTLPDADSERQAAIALSQQADALDLQVKAAKTAALSFSEEAHRRQDAIGAMGFDALYEAARLRTSGPPAVASPLNLKGGETAFLSTPATLARYQTRTHYVGGSSGFSFPIGHTGIRYRVGAYSGHPVQQQSLSKIDVGSLVLTNLRVAFIGRMKSTSMTLAKIMHVEVYNDGLSVFQEGKENPDFYLVSEPKRVVFLLNWVLNSGAA